MSAENIVPFNEKPQFAFVPVTPETALRWLDGNKVNRAIRWGKVDQYARDMAAGRWTFTNDAICFDSAGMLLNGQHRLLAVARSGCTVLLPVMRNVPAEAMTTMDSGAARTAADALGFDGEKNRAQLAAAVKLVLVYVDGRIYKDNRLQAVSHNEIREALERHPDIRRSVEQIIPFRNKIDAPPSTTAAAHWIIAQRAGHGWADVFFKQLAHRSNVPDGSPLLAVDSRLREIRRNRQTYPPRNYVYLFVKAWNLFAQDKTVRTLAITPKAGTEFRIPEPILYRR